MKHECMIQSRLRHIDGCPVLQMEVDAAEKRHRTRSKGVRGIMLQLVLSHSLSLIAFSSFLSHFPIYIWPFIKIALQCAAP